LKRVRDGPGGNTRKQPRKRKTYERLTKGRKGKNNTNQCLRGLGKGGTTNKGVRKTEATDKRAETKGEAPTKHARDPQK